MLIPFDYLFRKYDIKARGVCHLGSSFGQEREAYAKQGIEWVIWVEAIPEVFEKLKENIKPYPHNIAINACLSDKDGERRKFRVASNDGQSSSLLEFGTHAQVHPSVKFVREFEVETVRFDTLMERNNLTELLADCGWMANLDLQGMELACLRGFGDLLLNFKWAYVEINTERVYRNCPLVEDVDRYLKLFGFVRAETKMSGNHGWGDALYCKMD